MKKITLLLLSSLCSLFSFSQNEPTGTTLDEYNFMTKGYQIQLTSGLDMKKGYYVEDIVKYTIDTYDFDFKNLLRENTNTTAGIILIATSKVWGNTYYLAIPVDNDNLLSDFNSKVLLWDEPMTTAYSQASTLLMSRLFVYYNYNKKVLKK